MGDTDLTPDTPPAPGSSEPNFSMVQGVQTVGGGGSCGGMYTVRAGDTLSLIARTCNIALNDLISANPGLGNPNMIRPGQIIYIPAVGSPPVPDSGGFAAPQQEPASAVRTGGIPATGLLPGGSVDVQIAGFPADVQVQAGLGREEELPAIFGEGRTDANGRFKISAPIPLSAKVGERWLVTISTLDEPKVVVTSEPFEISQ